MSFSLVNFVIITVALSIGAVLQGSIGYGMGILVTPVQLLVDPRLVPGPFLLAAFVLIVLMNLREHLSIDLKGLRWVMLGSTPATILGAQLLAPLSAQAMNLTGLRFTPWRWVLVIAGALAGFMGVMGAVGEPPIALVYQHSSPERLRSTLSGYFIIATLITIAALIPVGRFGLQELKLTMVQLPGIVLGFFVSSRLVRLINSKSLHGIILAISTLSAVIVIAKQLIS